MACPAYSPGARGLVFREHGTALHRPRYPVDVRDNAFCHVGLLESARVANDERYFAWSTDAVDGADICARIDAVLPELSSRVTSLRDQFPAF